MALAETFATLFGILKSRDYDWQPQTPEQLLKHRKEPEAFSPLVRCFGLGLPLSIDELELEGIPPTMGGLLQLLRPAVSLCGGLYIAHDHWPPRTVHETSYVYFGQESLKLLECMQDSLEGLVGARILDLGCGGGALSLSLASLAQEVVGFDVAAKAVVWAGATAQAHGVGNGRFLQSSVGSPEADHAVGAAPWDAVVFNPPMVLARDEKLYPYRNGGPLGVELPLLFLDFSFRHLKPNGDVFCLATNPIVSGRPLLFDRIPREKWAFVERRCLHSQFNQSVYRKEGYAERGIERVELWYLHLKSRP